MTDHQIVHSVDMPGQLPHYEVPDTEMGLGASLGNARSWVTTGSDGRMLSLFSTGEGQMIAGPVIVRYATNEPGANEDNPGVPLGADGPGRYEIHSNDQRHDYRLPGGLKVNEMICLPQGEADSAEDVCAVYYVIELTNNSDRTQDLRAVAIAGLSGGRTQDPVNAWHDEDVPALLAQRNTSGKSGGCWALAATTDTSGYRLTTDRSVLYQTQHLPELDGTDQADGHVFGCLGVPVHLEPGKRERFAFVLSYSPHGEEEAARQAARMRDFEPILERSRQYQTRRLSPCEVATPDPVINDGAFWAKVNMLRVLARYPQGTTFTNEPGGSSNIVIRDVSWFIYGCDHFMPDASRELLNGMVRSQRDDGQMPEYYNAVTGETADYGLNISDPNPLFILAVNHHVRSTGDFDYLRSIYDSVKKAADYIIAQIDEAGLVFCTATGMKEHGIASWRNVLPHYQISGAVTEVNSECAAALRAMGHLAQNIDRPERESQYYRTHADNLAEAINSHLLDSRSGLYLLNINPNGERQTDVSADELFPVLFRVADEDTSYRIIQRLNSSDFWTTAGVRTASDLDPHYQPTLDVGLMGGVWPGVTWWFAFAAARYHPGLMVQALRASFEHYMRQPRVYQTVPGQFSEWFDGESLINRGMRLSPWEAPRFMWAAVEGIAGLMIAPGAPALNPLRPADWQWTAIHKLWYHGEQVSFFTVRYQGRIEAYTTVELQVDSQSDDDDDDNEESGYRAQVLQKEVTDQVRVGHSGLHVMALRDRERIVIALGSCRDEAIVSPIDLSGLVDKNTRYAVSRLSSEYGRWSDEGQSAGKDLSPFGVRVAGRGYHVVELRVRG